MEGGCCSMEYLMILTVLLVIVDDIIHVINKD